MRRTPSTRGALVALGRIAVAVAVIALAGAVVVPPAGAADPTYVLDNGRLRFGGGGHMAAAPASREASVDALGNLRQPFYWSGAANRWNKLTYSSYPLNVAIGSGAGSNWSGSQVIEDPPLSGQVIDGSGFDTATTEGGALVGSGRLVSTGTIDLSGAAVELRNSYELGADASFVRVTTQLHNVEASAIENVNLWVGTRDDWVGNSDSPTKTKGNLVDGAFVPTTDAATPGAALQITSANEGVLFYSTTPGTNTSISGCCSFSNAYNVNPTASPTTLTGDGSYALHLPVGQLAVDATAEIVWYYAAGTLADLADVVRQVADAAAPPRPEVVIGNGEITLNWQEPASDDPITDYAIRYCVAGTETCTEFRRGSAAAPLTEVITGLDNGTNYRFEIAAVTGTGEDEVVGDWSPTSDVAIPGVPRNVAAPTIDGDALVGRTLTAVDPDDAWVNNASGPMTASYRWQADGVDIPDATGPTLTVTSDLVGRRLSVVAIRTNDVGATEITSAASDAVPALPRLTGLTLSDGELEPAFDEDVASYLLTVHTATGTIRVTPTAPGGTTLTVEGVVVPLGTEHEVEVPYGRTTLTIRVSYAGQVLERTLVVERAAPFVPAPETPTTTTVPSRPAPSVPTPAPAPPVLGLGTGTGTGTGAGTGGATSAPSALYITPTGQASEVALPPTTRARPVVAAVAVSASESIAVGPGGQVFLSNPAHDFGQLPAGMRLNAPVTNIGLHWSARTTAATGAGGATWEPSGYWMAAADGGVFAFGDAAFHGSMGAAKLNEPVVGIAPTGTGAGYWLVASDGGVFTFGNAGFFGSLGDRRLNQPIVSIVPTVSGRGYWLIGADGGVFSFGDATFFGSGARTGQRFIGAAPSPTGAGYWLVAADRRLHGFGDAAAG